MPNHKLAKTNAVWHKSYVEFSYKQQYKYKPVTHELLNYLQTHSLVLELWGKQGKLCLFVIVSSLTFLLLDSPFLNSRWNYVILVITLKLFDSIVIISCMF